MKWFVWFVRKIKVRMVEVVKRDMVVCFGECKICEKEWNGKCLNGIF